MEKDSIKYRTINKFLISSKMESKAWLINKNNYLPVKKQVHIKENVVKICGKENDSYWKFLCVCEKYRNYVHITNRSYDGAYQKCIITAYNFVIRGFPMYMIYTIDVWSRQFKDKEHARNRLIDFFSKYLIKLENKYKNRNDSFIKEFILMFNIDNTEKVKLSLYRNINIKYSMRMKRFTNEQLDYILSTLEEINWLDNTDEFFLHNLFYTTTSYVSNQKGKNFVIAMCARGMMDFPFVDKYDDQIDQIIVDVFNQHNNINNIIHILLTKRYIDEPEECIKLLREAYDKCLIYST